MTDRHENWQRSGSAIAAAVRRARTTCPNGHPWSETNTYPRGHGQGRGCRACRRAAAERYAQKRRAFLDNYKREHGCLDCGTREGRLDLDHRSGEVKLFDLSKARVAWPRLLEELAKCDVRCIACHSRRHGLERGGIQPSSDVTEAIQLPVVADAEAVCRLAVA